MRYTTWIGLLAAVSVIVVCHASWVYVPSVHLSIGGMFSSGKQNFGRPGLMNIICSAIAAVLFILPQLWAKRSNIFCCGFNIAWAVRNYILLSRCYGGECPVKQTSLYLLLIASAVMLLMALIPDAKLNRESKMEQVQL